MNTLRIALCEDDADERQSLLKLIADSNYNTKVSVFTSGEGFLAQFQPCQFDLILMDIFMENVSGIDVITQVRTWDSQTPVAFITSSMAFTRESYRLDAVKYIEKPATAKQIADLLQIAQLNQQTLDSLALRINNEPVTIPLRHILHLEQQAHALVVHLLDGEVVTANKKLQEVEGQLLDKGFLRCHKSYVVNLAYVRRINKELSTFEMAEGEPVYIRRRSFAQMQKAFEAHLFGGKQAVPYD